MWIWSSLESLWRLDIFETNFTIRQAIDSQYLRARLTLFFHPVSVLYPRTPHTRAYTPSLFLYHTQMASEGKPLVEEKLKMAYPQFWYDADFTWQWSGVAKLAQKIQYWNWWNCVANSLAFGLQYTQIQIEVPPGNFCFLSLLSIN